MTVLKVTLWCWVVVMLGLPWLIHTGTAADAAANAGVFLGGFFVAVCLGEVVLAAIARLLGDRPFAMMIGIGPVLHRRLIASCGVELRILPLVGLTLVATTRAEGQWRRYLVARGVAIVALVVLAAVLFARFGRLSLLWGAMASRFAPDAYAFIICCVVAAFSVLALFVIRTLLPGWLRHGLLLEVVPILRRGAYAQAEARCRALLATHPDDVQVQLLLASTLAHGASDEALAILQAVVARADLSTDERATAANNLAWQCYLNDRDDLRLEAEHASVQALEHASSNPHFIGTRGHICLWAQRYAEAEPLLAKAHAAFERDQPSARATAAAGLAMLCAATDRTDEARTWLERARAEGVTHDLVARATAAVEPLSRK